MKIGIICGSPRDPSQSEKVAHIIEQALLKLDVQPWVYLLANNPLPLWDQSIWDDDPQWQKRLTPLQNHLSECDGFVVISPEYHGQVPAALKNFFLMFNKKVLGHKPALIVAVSAGAGGSYPIAELRMSSYKNNRLCYIPEHLIIRQVESVLNDDASENDADSDAYYRKRIDWSLEVLKGYAKAMKSMREDTPVFHDDFSNGM